MFLVGRAGMPGLKVSFGCARGGLSCHDRKPDQLDGAIFCVSDGLRDRFPSEPNDHGVATPATALCVLDDPATAGCAHAGVFAVGSLIEGMADQDVVEIENVFQCDLGTSLAAPAL